MGCSILIKLPGVRHPERLAQMFLLCRAAAPSMVSAVHLTVGLLLPPQLPIFVLLARLPLPPALVPGLGIAMVPEAELMLLATPINPFPPSPSPLLPTLLLQGIALLLLGVQRMPQAVRLADLGPLRGLSPGAV